MTAEPSVAEDDIESMLDSIEEAIGDDVSWSDLPPPVELVELEVDEPAPRAPRLDIATELAPRDAAPFAGLSCELRTYPDARPRLAEAATRISGTTAAVMARFNWGGT